MINFEACNFFLYLFCYISIFFNENHNSMIISHFDLFLRDIEYVANMKGSKHHYSLFLFFGVFI